jgi:valyl-tRNA synthetase
MENIQPWCISRQLWWGHQIPAWHGPDGRIFVAMDEKEAMEQARNQFGKDVQLTRDPDVLDTWFSSALWPFSTLGWENGDFKKADWKQMKKYYPTDVLVTGFDIIFFWVARMMMMGLHFMKDVPFREVYIHALVRDASGQKMSKSKGNVIDPLIVSDTYGCDALRFTLAALSVPGRDIKMSEQRVEGYRNFATKLWNAARFCEMNGCAIDPKFNPAKVNLTVNRWMVGEIVTLQHKIDSAMAEYRFDEIANDIYHTA